MRPHDGGDARGGGHHRGAELGHELLARAALAGDGHADRGRREAVGVEQGHGERAQPGGQLLVVDGQAGCAHVLQLGAQGALGGDAVGAVAHEPQRRDQPLACVLGQIREQRLAHRGAVAGQARAQAEVAIEGVLARAPAAQPVDEPDVGAVENRQRHGVPGLAAQAAQVLVC